MVQRSRSQTALMTFSRSWFKVQGHRQHWSHSQGHGSKFKVTDSICFMMRTTDDVGMPVPRDISRTVLWVRGCSSWLRTVSFTWSMFSFVQALRGLSLPWRLSTVPVSANFLSNLLMLLLSILCLGILSSTVSHYIPLTDIIFYQNLISIAVYKQCSDIWRLGWHSKCLPN